MFGQSRLMSAELKAWLDLLKRAEPATRRGELVVRSLVEDANVCPKLQAELEAFVSREPTVATPDEAADRYDRFLSEIGRNDAICHHPDNSPHTYRSIRLDKPPRSS